MIFSGHPIVVCVLGLAGIVGGDLIENHTVSLGTVVGVAAIVLPTAWWLGSKFKEIDDRDREIAESLLKSEARLREDIEEIKGALKVLPCVDPKCDPKSESK